MSLSIPTPEHLKSKAKAARQFLSERCKVDISHSQSLELLSQLYGFKDWNTATAELSAIDRRATDISAFERVKALASLKSPRKEGVTTERGLTFGEFRQATKDYPDSGTLDFNYSFNLGEFMNSIDDVENPEDMIHQEFVGIQVTKVDADYACVELALSHESSSFER